jgi:hypothetical protein
MKIRLRELRAIIEASVSDDIRKLLLKIDSGDYHMAPVVNLSAIEIEDAEQLSMMGLLKHLPRSDRFPERFVLTPTGSHAIDTFKFSTL